MNSTRYLCLALILALSSSMACSKGPSVEQAQKAVENPKSDFEQGQEALKQNDYSLAESSFTKVIQKEPKNAAAYHMRGFALLNQHNYEPSVRDYTKAIELYPSFAGSFNERGNAYLELKQFDKALADYDAAIRLDPRDSYAYNNRGTCFRKMKQYAKSLEDHKKAVAIDPKDPLAYNSLAWLLAVCPEAKFRDGKAAVEYGHKACELTQWKDPYNLDTLAAAYAEAGMFQEAVKTQKQALQFPELTKIYGDKPRDRLKLYEEGKPYREE